MKSIYLIPSFLLFTLTIMAQNSIGFKIGGNTNFASVTGISNSILPEINSYTGFSAGVDANLKMDEKFSFKPAINYTEKGFIMRETTSTDIIGIDLPLGVQANTKVNYIDVNALLQLNYAQSDKFHGYVFAGPTLAYATNASVQTKANFIIDINVKKFDLDLSDDTYNRYEFGVAGGAGIGTSIGKGEIFAEVKYQHGFTDQINNPIFDLGVKNRSVNFGIGYRINI